LADWGVPARAVGGVDLGGGIDQAVVVSGAGSTAAAGRVIASYEWDLDNDGTFDVSTDEPTYSHVFTVNGTFTHDVWEEVFILEGEIHDIPLGKTFTKGMYACRPPGMKHGPWTSKGGAVTFETRFPPPGEVKS
jgi:hypothetical protein